MGRSGSACVGSSGGYVISNNNNNNNSLSVKILNGYSLGLNKSGTSVVKEILFRDKVRAHSHMQDDQW